MRCAAWRDSGMESLRISSNLFCVCGCGPSSCTKHHHLLKGHHPRRHSAASPTQSRTIRATGDPKRIPLVFNLGALPESRPPPATCLLVIHPAAIAAQGARASLDGQRAGGHLGRDSRRADGHLGRDPKRFHLGLGRLGRPRRARRHARRRELIVAALAAAAGLLPRDLRS